MKIKKLTILAVVGLVAAFMPSGGGGVAQAAHCTTTVTAPASIQTAIDGATSGDVVCLDDFGGSFSQVVVFSSTASGDDDSGITLSAEDGDSPVLDGTSLAGAGSVFAITLEGGVSDVTIEDLEIRNYKGDASGSDRSSAIVAALGTTTDITVRKNFLHDNQWNGVLVFSEGDFIHTGWMVEKNFVTDNGFVGIELTNTSNSTISKNFVADNDEHGIVVQARDTTDDDTSVVVTGVVVSKNDVSGTPNRAGIRLLAFEGNVSTFVHLTGESARLTGSTVEKNDSHHNTGSTRGHGIRLDAFNEGATADFNRLEKNTVVANTVDGIHLLATCIGASCVDATVENNDVEKNKATGNGGDGFEADTSGANTFDKNKSNINGGFGYNEVAGSNTYTKNKCKFNAAGGSAPSGLCGPQP